MLGLQHRFEKIYATNLWQYGSGEGSLPIHTKGYVRFIERFIRSRAITSVVDVGCGDWQFSRSIDWHGANYRGFDVVRPVIEANVAKYANDSISFHLAPEEFADLPEADLLIAKDVLQHWSHQTIQTFLRVLPKYKYALITNSIDVPPRRFWRPDPREKNRDIEDGDYRRLDLRLPPYNLPGSAVYSFTAHRTLLQRARLKRRPWLKVTLLLQRGA